MIGHITSFYIERMEHTKKLHSTQMISLFNPNTKKDNVTAMKRLLEEIKQNQTEEIKNLYHYI